MSRELSLLVNGRIPKGQECPFVERCSISKGRGCNHKGKDHSCDFSCAFARGFDMVSKDPAGGKLILQAIAEASKK